MEPRDIFDGALVAFALVALYLELIGFGFSQERLNEVIEAILGIDLAFYIVMGGFLAIGFLIYAFVYVPRQQSQKMS